MFRLNRKLQKYGHNALQFSKFRILHWQHTGGLIIMFFAAIALMTSVVVFPANANVGTKAGEENAKALMLAFYFTNERPSGEMRVAIVHDRNNEHATQDALAFANGAEQASRVKNISLRPELIRQDVLASVDLSRFDAVLISRGMRAHYPELRNLLNGYDGIVASQDKRCVQSNLCMLYIEKTHVINMAVNQKVVKDRNARYSFRSGFVKMIEQISS